MATFFRFSRGTTGASSAHLSYISRPAALRDGAGATFFRNLPEQVVRAESYGELRTNLTSYAWMREEVERSGFRGRGECRTHFRALFSFEEPVPTETVRGLVEQWLQTCLPKARAVGFIHTDTGHTHAHLWLDARDVDGKKLSLPPSLYRKLDEVWNWLYSRALGRDEQEHLRKKGRHGTLAQERGLRKAVELPDRRFYTVRERRNAGGDKLEQARARRDQSGATGVGERVGERQAPAHPLLEVSLRADRAAHGAVAAAARALDETHALRQDLERLDQQPERPPGGYERER